ncbi:golgin candidate 4-like isoform X2 [Nymphaea colorata]|uniref:golgin candidate 4-like isoform X2 n=1 Tax=Nymphaea colorata TaxID=210225 RepID=UPI00129E23BA|nr:golgin candidate 4-like isoform X2 [Nymphaea colorata]
MRNSIASLKENLSRIALDVHGDTDDDEFAGSLVGQDGPESDRRVSQRLAQSKHSTISNGNAWSHQAQLDDYKAEVERLKASEAEIRRLSINYAAILKEKEEDGEQSPSRQPTQVSQTISSSRNHSYGGPSNGSLQAMKHDEFQLKEFARSLEESNSALEALRADHEVLLTEMKQLREQLEKERVDSTSTKLQLEGEQNSNKSFQKELHAVKVERDRSYAEMKELHDCLDKKTLEVERLQLELNRRDAEETVQASESMPKSISALEKEITDLKIKLSKFSREKEKAEATTLHLEQKLKDACHERDKAVQEVARLKKHLLDKHFEESEKMDADGNLIEELQANCELQRTRIVQLESSLRQAISSQEEIKKINGSELHRSNEIIKELRQKLASCMSTIDSKNVELLNLQTALGQYYAESEAKERLLGDLAVAREDLSHMSQSLAEANHALEISKKEKVDLLLKLSQAERMLMEGKNMFKALEEDNLKLRRALEQSMTRINRMSVDSDYYVDRRIVIKLLVTYLERNHSKEVLDLMVRMLGFSDEDKKRIGFLLAGGKGVARGVWGLPGRLVGGILGGNSAAPAHVSSDNQSFADLWVDFLLKETQERGGRATEEAGTGSEGSRQSFGVQTAKYNSLRPL